MNRKPSVQNDLRFKVRCSKRLGSEMELHPILETDTFPNPGLWYVLSGYGEYPSMRVGESCSYIPGKSEGDNGRLYIIGGANPSGPFCDTYVLDLNTQKWDLIDAPGFRARYEHAAFTPACHPNKIYIFGGADQTGNMNDIQVFDTESNTWSSVTVSGNPPSERTYHTSSATVGNKFIVYGGGHCGPDPVSDRQVHCFDATSLSWTTLNIRGDSPKPRHGHVTVAVGNKVFIHGGMAGANFYNDLHVLNLEKNTWSDVKRKKIYPSARAGHSAVAIGNNVYIFGGMNRDGALDEMYQLDTGTLQWTKLDIQGPPPPCRLDFGMCMIQLRRGLATESTSDVVSATRQAQETLEREMTKPGSASSRSSCPDFAVTDSVVSAIGAEASSFPDNSNLDDVDGATAHLPEAAPSDQKTFHLCLIHGGMDTVGEVFDDVMIVNLETT